jgi:hypothetical protein
MEDTKLALWLLMSGLAVAIPWSSIGFFARRPEYVLRNIFGARGEKPGSMASAGNTGQPPARQSALASKPTGALGHI